MPEYLAPAVYVEETSFRPKPIEGVSTSTTAFVGPTNRGPISDTPELITSAGDFERIYGGTHRLDLNAPRPFECYLAHAVRAYFANGGSRLYVARAYQGRPDPENPGELLDGIARSALVVDDGGNQARFVARFPGASGNGGVQVIQQTAPAAWASMVRAQPGTMVRTGADNPALPATVEGGVPPFRLEDGAELHINVSGSNHTLVFNGGNAEVTAASALGTPVTLDGTNNALTVTLNGVEQVITLAEGDRTPAERVQEINEALEGGYATLTGSDEIRIGSEIRGTDSRVRVAAHAALGFDSEATDTGTGNVPNLSRVSASDVAALLAAEGATVDVSVNPATLRLRISTEDVGSGESITISAAPAGTVSAHVALGLPEDAENGVDGSTLAYYVKAGSQWLGATPGEELTEGSAPSGGMEFVSINIIATDRDGLSKNYDELAFSPEHPRFVGHVLAPEPDRRRDQLENVFALELTGDVAPHALRAGLLGSQEERLHVLEGGNDGAQPAPERYREALERLQVLEDISIVAAPGFTAYANYEAIRDHVRNHVERRRAYEIAVLDTPPAQTVGEARNYRSSIDSKYAAIYYPWVVISNPDTRPGDRSIPSEITVPPSGHVCGIYARNDVQRGVHKAPANEVVRGALRFETRVNTAEQEVLNPEGVNALRTFPGRGHRVWGARIATSDGEWKYVNVRRYFNYIEASIDRATQWVVFEPNGPKLWARIRGSVTDFLHNEWRNGALLGTTPKEAFFVRCDRSTMTENDLENGRLICEVGIAVIKPAEFVIFRIGQWTASARS